MVCFWTVVRILQPGMCLLFMVQCLLKGLHGTVHVPCKGHSVATFWCRTATKKNNEIHSDPRFLEGKQMGSHFLKSTTVQKLLFFYVEKLFQLHMKIYYSALGKSLNLVSACWVCPSANLTLSSGLSFCCYLFPSSWKAETPRPTERNFTNSIFSSRWGFLMYFFFGNRSVLRFIFGNVPSTSCRNNEF